MTLTVLFDLFLSNLEQPPLTNNAAPSETPKDNAANLKSASPLISNVAQCDSKPSASSQEVSSHQDEYSISSTYTYDYGSDDEDEEQPPDEEKMPQETIGVTFVTRRTASTDNAAPSDTDPSASTGNVAKANAARLEAASPLTINVAQCDSKPSASNQEVSSHQDESSILSSYFHNSDDEDEEQPPDEEKMPQETIGYTVTCGTIDAANMLDYHRALIRRSHYETMDATVTGRQVGNEEADSVTTDTESKLHGSGLWKKAFAEKTKKTVQSAEIA